MDFRRDLLQIFADATDVNDTVYYDDEYTLFDKIMELYYEYEGLK